MSIVAFSIWLVKIKYDLKNAIGKHKVKVE